jgi:hypothetical protein
MKDVILGVAVIGMLLTFFVQLNTIAESVSAQTIDFAIDMDEGLSCVLEGKLLVECQPELFEDYGFNENLNTTIDVLDDFGSEFE